MPRASQAPMPRSYGEAARMLGQRESRVIANNTRLIWHPATGDLSVRLHLTDVVTFHAPGRHGGQEQIIELSHGGYQTLTTMDRIRRCLPYGFNLTGGVTSRTRPTLPFDRIWSLHTPSGAVYEWLSDNLCFDATHYAAGNAA